MSVLIGQYEFEGPMINWRGVRQVEGIYAILSFSKQEYELVDLGESEDLQSELLKEDRQEYWQRESRGLLVFCVHYYPKASRGRRQEIVHEIMQEFTGDFTSPAKLLEASAS